ncbi:MAG: ADP-ribosylglycohydrolase family protein [Nitriliruptoraceae bacterium]
MPAAPEPDDAIGCLLGLALGDALGAPFEGRARVDPSEVDRLVAGIGDLRWTDDTHMALTLARALAAHGLTIDTEQLGDRFAAAYQREPWRGYGSGPPQVFALAARGCSYPEAAARLFGGGGSFGNGGAMRCAPVAIAGFPDTVAIGELAAEQARVTHSHPEGLDGAVLLATVVGLALATPADQPLQLTAAELDVTNLRSPALQAAWRRLLAAAGHPDGGPPSPADELLALAEGFGTSVPARESVPAAVAIALGGGDGVVEVIRAAISLGGDTDTVAAMAGAITGAHLGAAAIPSQLLARLEAREGITGSALALVEAVRSRRG